MTTEAISRDTTPKVSGSVAVSPKSMPSKNRVSARAPRTNCGNCKIPILSSASSWRVSVSSVVMSFNGEKNTSFKKWCDLNKCRTSSYDLDHRIQFDVWSIVKELKQSDYDLRVMNAKIRETADVFNNEAAYRH